MMALAAVMPATAAPPGQGAKASKKLPSLAEARNDLLKRPGKFIQNAGQWNSKARFLARAPGLDYWVTDKGVVFDYYASTRKGGHLGAHGDAIEMTLAGGRDGNVQGARPIGSITDFINARNHVRRSAEGYAEVWNRGLAKGVDMRSYLEGPAPRYDLVVHPDANASHLRLAFKGAEGLSVDAKGELVLKTSLGERKQVGLRAYQVVNGKRHPVQVAFNKVDGRSIGFRLGAYDHSRDLVVDPLIYGSYYGGDNGIDQVNAVVEDNEGGVYLTGATKSPQFPAIFGPYGFNLAGGFDAFLSKLQGDAYNHDYAALIVGSGDDIGRMLQVDQYGNVWVAGTTTSADFPGNTRSSVFHIRQRSIVTSFDVDGGSYLLLLDGSATAPIAFDASADQVQTQLRQTATNLGIDPSIISVTGTAVNSNDGLVVTIAPGNVVTLSVFDGPRVIEDPNNPSPTVGAQFDPEGLQSHYVVTFNPKDPPQQGHPIQFLEHIGAQLHDPNATFTLTFAGQTTTPIRELNCTASDVQKALAALSTVGSTNNVPNVTCQVVNSPNGTLPGPDGAFMRIQFTGTAATAPVPQMTIAESISQPDDHYVVDQSPQVWLMRFKQSTTTVLDPFENGVPQSWVLNSTDQVNLAGFAVAPGTTSGPVNLILGVNTFAVLPDVTEQPQGAFATRKEPFGIDASNSAGIVTGGGAFLTISYDSTASTPFSIVQEGSHYVNANAPLDLTGLALDSQGNIYASGTLYASGNSDTSSDPNPVFQTTDGVFSQGRLSRGFDIWVRKYSSIGQIKYSALVGGNNTEWSGGRVPTRYFVNNERMWDTTGSSIAVDQDGDAYITGFTNSFDYPRTRGVYGEVFDGSAREVVVTKINTDGSQLVYSTNLRTGGNIYVSGIAVDTRGQAYVTGTVEGILDFWDPPAQAGDPVQPTAAAANRGVIPTSSDALLATSSHTDSPDIDTADGYLLVLNDTATDLVYGSYIGGLLDDQVYAPYTDSFGDCWVMGWNDQYRVYDRVSSTGTDNHYETGASLSAGSITPLAFKQTVDPGAGSSDDGWAYGIQNWNNGGLGDPRQPFTLDGIFYRRDGFVMRFRLGLPTVQSLNLSPSSLPGGDPTGGSNPPSTTATVNLSSPAPSGGVTLDLTLDSNFGSFSKNTDQTASTLTIPEGATSGSFPVYTRAVQSNTSLQIEANYQNNYKIANLSIVPWLSQIALAPSSVVGGNVANGRILLAAPAPSDVSVPLTVAPSGLLTTAGSTTLDPVIVKAGQDSATFALQTNGVAQSTDATLSASLLGVSKTAGVTVTPASMISLKFSPTEVAVGTPATGTITLNGNSPATGTPLTIALQIVGSPAGFSVPATVTFAPNTSTATFTVSSPVMVTGTPPQSIVVQATNNATGQTVSGTLLFDSAKLTGFTVTPTTATAGDTLTGTVSIAAPAPSGGVSVAIAAGTRNVVTYPSTVTIPAGTTSATFPINALGVSTQMSTVIYASRGGTPLTQTVTVNPPTLTLVLSDNSILGGGQVSGVAMLSANAPAGGIQITLSCSPSGVATPDVNPITIPAGQNSAPFTIDTSTVSSNQTVTITGSYGSVTSAPVTLLVRAVGLASFKITPQTLRSLQNATGTVTLDSPAPAGGYLVSLSSSDGLSLGTYFRLYPQINGKPAVLVPAGQTTYSFTLAPQRFSRTVRETVTAAAGSTTLNSTVVINP